MRNSKKARIAKYCMLMSGIITVIIGMSDFIMRQIIKLKLNTDIPLTSSSIGIIGGADGPTAIFLADNNSLSSKWILLSIFLPATIICFLFLRKYSKSE